MLAMTPPSLSFALGGFVQQVAGFHCGDLLFFQLLLSFPYKHDSSPCGNRTFVSFGSVANQLSLLRVAANFNAFFHGAHTVFVRMFYGLDNLPVFAVQVPYKEAELAGRLNSIRSHRATGSSTHARPPACVGFSFGARGMA